MIFGAKKAVFFGAHTDDEMVCAGTLHRLAREGCEVHVVTFVPAATILDRTGTEKSVEVVTPEWRESVKVIGAAHGEFLAITPSADLHPHRQRICQYVYDYCERERPDVALILSPTDENTAHAIVGVESERVMRGRVPTVVRCLFPWNYAGTRPNLYVSLEPSDLLAKRKVIDAYRSQHFRYRYRDMLLSYVEADGLSVKVPAAEKFEIVRSVV